MDDVIEVSPVARTAVVQLVQVRVGTCDIAICIDNVLMALPLPPQGLTELPRRSGGLLGVADVAGSAVPIVALERWLPMAETGSDQAAVPRLLVLQHAGVLVGIRVDAVLGVKTVAWADISRVHQASDDNELFDSVVPASASDPTLCILEVARLVQLSQTWCESAELSLAVLADSQASASAAKSSNSQRRYAVFLIGTERWAVPLDAVERVVPLPATELTLGPIERSWAISQLQGRKLPLVDISKGRQASDRQSAPWMVLVGQGPLALGLTVSVCEQFLVIDQNAVASTPEDPIAGGVVLLPQIGKLQILDVAKLFGLTPEASISRSAPVVSAVQGDVSSDATEPLPYLVFDADQRYATPVEGIVGVVELTSAARDDLHQGRRAVIAWRGRTVQVSSLPAIGKSKGPSNALLAVLVQPLGSTSPPVGIAIRRLCDWLPAHSARRSGMRMGAMGELGLINAKGALDHANLVVVDLGQIAYLLG